MDAYQQYKILTQFEDAHGENNASIKDKITYYSRVIVSSSTGFPNNGFSRKKTFPIFFRETKKHKKLLLENKKKIKYLFKNNKHNNNNHNHRRWQGTRTIFTKRDIDFNKSGGGH